MKNSQIDMELLQTSREMEDRYMIWEEIINDAREEGRMEGLEAGRIEGQIKSLIKVLHSLGEIPDNLLQIISEESNLETLEDYFTKALKAKSIKEFEESIKN